MILMRILIYGAGVIGSLYAAIFAEAGYDTSIYARGKRFEALRNNGLLYKKNQEVNPKELSSFRDIEACSYTIPESNGYASMAALSSCYGGTDCGCVL